MNYAFEKALNKIEGLVIELKQELPGIALGYMGYIGRDEPLNGNKNGWYIFLPHPKRVGTNDDWVYLGATEDDLVNMARYLTDLAVHVRRMYRAGGARVVSADMDNSSEITAVRLTQKPLAANECLAIG